MPYAICKPIYLIAIFSWFVLIFTVGCGCSRETPNRAISTLNGSSPERSSSKSDNVTKSESTPSARGLSIIESAYITSPKGGFTQGKDKNTIVTSRRVGADFERKYIQGVEMMERGEYGDAMKIFNEIIEQYPNTEEASIAEYCIAEIYFRNKANQKALEAYKRIIEKYPNSPAAENAREGIEYLQTFEIHEREYVSPDVEDRRRRGY